ncbi:hypothetical protein FACS189440_07140 [Bacteroidia bacterium]|nr:hypothetical protein FACS189423_05210 [Bacteroidia bacterium]GHT47230.1 hypothetical protein FACS189440_07140 [Bacteroidia bacterium]
MELQVIQNCIYEIRGQKVMLDSDLAEIYQVETKQLKRAVRRNIERFPLDFMFELTENECEILRCQIGTSKQNDNSTTEKRGGSRYLPFAFTEQGVAQLSSVLHSPFAIAVNLTIVRAFVALRQYALGYAELNRKLENFMSETDMQFNEVYQALTELAEQKKLAESPRRPIGYQHYYNS